MKSKLWGNRNRDINRNGNNQKIVKLLEWNAMPLLDRAGSRRP